MKRWGLVVLGGVVVVAGLVYAALSVWSTDPCIVGERSCSRGNVCAKGVSPPYESARCVAALPASHGTYALPLLNPDGVICTQSSQTPSGSHGYDNTLFALDLSSPLKGPAGVVVAARAGTVIRAQARCTDPGRSGGYSDDCGQGFGNTVLIDHGDDTAALYAHLAALEVARGQRIARGAVVGREGITGSAGHRHLHFSVHAKRGALPLAGGMSWRAIPFRIRLREGAPTARVQERDVRALSCPHNKFDHARWYTP